LKTVIVHDQTEWDSLPETFSELTAVHICEVARKNIVVYATDITKVRCRKVKVIGEWKEEG
jgi:hypothetical protein